MIAGIVSAVLTLAAYGLVLWLTVKRVRRASPVVVMRHLREQGRYMVKVGAMTQVWTPEQPPSRHLAVGYFQMPGRGKLAYSLDAPAGRVQLRWESRRGTAREWSGPAPATGTAGFVRARRRGVGLVVMTVTALLLFGALVGVVNHSLGPSLVGAGLAGYFISTSVYLGHMSRHLRTARAESGLEAASRQQEP